MLPLRKRLKKQLLKMPRKKTTVTTEPAQLTDPAKYTNDDSEDLEEPDEETKTKPRSGSGRDDGEGGGGRRAGGVVVHLVMNHRTTKMAMTLH